MPEKNNGIIEQLTSSEAGLGLPDPVQKGILKAADRLLGGFLDIGGAYLEGFAEDRRATTEARKLLRMKAAESLVAGFKSDSPLANRAFAKQATKILGEQINIEDIMGIAIEDVAKNGKAASGGDIDEDWFNGFEAEACKKSSDDMKLVFGRILSGEIQKPGTFSLSAIRSLGTMGSDIAAAFREFCSLITIVAGGFDYRVVSVEGNPSQNKLQRFGFSYSRLNKLREYGLINTEYESQLDYSQFASMRAPISYAGSPFSLTANAPKSKLLAKGVELTQIGREIYQIIDLVENTEYTKALIKHCADNGYSLAPI